MEIVILEISTKYSRAPGRKGLDICLGIKKGFIEKVVFQWRLKSWTRGVRVCPVETQHWEKTKNKTRKQNSGCRGKWIWENRLVLRNYKAERRKTVGGEAMQKSGQILEVSLCRHCKVDWILLSRWWLAMEKPPGRSKRNMLRSTYRKEYWKRISERIEGGSKSKT